MLKFGIALEARPSVTEISMLVKLPTSSLSGVPVRRPVARSNVAQAGFRLIVNSSVSPSGSLAFGVNSYNSPARMLGGGEPEIVGARLPAIGFSLPLPLPLPLLPGMVFHSESKQPLRTTAIPIVATSGNLCIRAPLLPRKRAHRRAGGESQPPLIGN